MKKAVSVAFSTLTSYGGSGAPAEYINKNSLVYTRKIILQPKIVFAKEAKSNF